MSDIGGAAAMSNAQSASMSQHSASQVSSGFSNQISNAIKSSIGPSGKLDVHEATDKLHMMAASTTNPTEKAACNHAIEQLQNAASSMNNAKGWDSKLAESIAGSSLAAAMNGAGGISPTSGFAFSDSMQVSLQQSGHHHHHQASGANFHSHLFGPKPVEGAQKTVDQTNSGGTA